MWREINVPSLRILEGYEYLMFWLELVKVNAANAIIVIIGAVTITGAG